MHVHQPTPDVTSLSAAAEIPGLGFLPINAFVVHAAEPVLIDTGAPQTRTEFLDALWSVVEPADLRWIYLTHPDRDHTGALADVLAAAPQARFVTTFVGFGIATMDFPMSPERAYWLNPGQSLDVGDRRLTAFRPPVYDSPATTGLYDERSGTMFSSDCFGAPLGAAADTEVADVAELSKDAVEAGQRLWVTVDSPWVANVDRAMFGASMGALRAMNPELVLSTHLPPARKAMPRLLETLSTAPDANAFVGPDQAMLDAMLTSMHAPVPACRRCRPCEKSAAHGEKFISGTMRNWHGNLARWPRRAPAGSGSQIGHTALVSAPIRIISQGPGTARPARRRGARSASRVHEIANPASLTRRQRRDSAADDDAEPFVQALDRRFNLPPGRSRWGKPRAVLVVDGGPGGMLAASTLRRGNEHADQRHSRHAMPRVRTASNRVAATSMRCPKADRVTAA